MTTSTIQQLTIQLNKALSIAQNLETEPINVDIKIDLIEPIKETDTCYLCLEDLDTNKNFISYCCGHKTHFTCFIKNSSLSQNPDNCGYCRQKLVSDEIKEEIRLVKRQSRIEENRRQREYMNELRRENNIAELPIRRQVLVDSDDSSSDSDLDLEATVVINEPFLPLPARRQRQPRRMNRRVVVSRNLVIQALNEDTGNNEIYLTIPQIRRQIQINAEDLSEATISTRIRELVATNQVSVGNAGGNRRNYRLVRNYQRHQ